ncbi:hypothetical protein ACJX0J_011572, partial [Zea mays]
TFFMLRVSIKDVFTNTGGLYIIDCYGGVHVVTLIPTTSAANESVIDDLDEEDDDASLKTLETTLVVYMNLAG